MNGRRTFMRIAAGALPASAAVVAAQADNGSVKALLGAWMALHASPVGPFRELLMFAEGGAFTETNALLHTNSNLTFFSQFGLPPVLNASDGIGSWERVGPGEIGVSFRKLLFDGDRAYIGDFWVKGAVRIEGSRLHADWHQIWIVDTSNELLLDLGPAASEGSRIE